MLYYGGYTRRIGGTENSILTRYPDHALETAPDIYDLVLLSMIKFYSL